MEKEPLFERKQRLKGALKALEPEDPSKAQRGWSNFPYSLSGGTYFPQKDEKTWKALFVAETVLNLPPNLLTHPAVPSARNFFIRDIKIDNNIVRETVYMDGELNILNGNDLSTATGDPAFEEGILDDIEELIDDESSNRHEQVDDDVLLRMNSLLKEIHEKIIHIIDDHPEKDALIEYFKKHAMELLDGNVLVQDRFGNQFYEPERKDSLIYYMRLLGTKNVAALLPFLEKGGRRTTIVFQCLQELLTQPPDSKLCNPQIQEELENFLKVFFTPHGFLIGANDELTNILIELYITSLMWQVPALEAMTPGIVDLFKHPGRQGLEELRVRIQSVCINWENVSHDKTEEPAALTYVKKIRSIFESGL